MSNRVSVEIDANVTGFQEGMTQATDSAQKYETETRKVADAQVNLMKELKNAKREVQNLAAGYAKLDAEAKKSAFGREMARQLQEAKEKAAEYIDLQGDLNTELKNMASDTHTLDMLSEGMGVFANVTSSALGVVAQFTGNEKDAQKAIVAFTTAQSTLSAVTKIQNALQMQSNTMMAVLKVQTLAAAAAERIKTAATNQGVIATKAATVAQAAFNAVAKANPYVLLASAVLTVVSALAAFCVFSGKSAAEQEHENKMTERAERITTSYYDALNSALEETIPKYIRLRTEWSELRTEAEKIQWIKDNQDEFNALGIEVENVNDAENVLCNQTNAVMNSFIKRAQAIAIAQQAAELYKQALEDVQWLEEHRYDNTLKSSELSEHGFDTRHARIDHHGGWLGTGHARYALTDADAMIEERKRQAEQKMEELYKEMGRLQEEGEKELTDAGVKSIKESNKKRNNACNAGSRSTRKVIHKNSVEEAEELVKTWEEALKQADVDDTELVARINEEINKAKKEVERRKIAVGLTVNPEIVIGSSGWWQKEEKKLTDEINNLVEGSLEWFNKKDQLEQLKQTRELQTKGVTVNGSASLSKALGGDFDKTLKGYNDAISALQNKLQNTDWSKMGEDGSKTFQNYIDLIQQYKEELQSLQDVYDESMLTPLEKANKKLAETSESITAIGNAVQAAGQLFSALGDAAESNDLKAAGIVAQAVATVALSFAQALTTAKTWVDWLAFGLTGMATMATMISQIKSLSESHAGGGIVGGSSYHGDRILTSLDSGEMILNKRQQRNLFNLLDESTMPQHGGVNVQVSGVIRGTDLLLVQKNTNKVLSKAGSKINF